MSKGQKRSSREIRKPKQEKTPAKPETGFGAQVKAAAVLGGPGKGKGKV